MRSVSDQVCEKYSYTLNNPELVLSRLEIADFYREEILNIDLLVYLLETKNKNQVYVVKMLEKIMKDNKFKFVSEFLSTRKEIDSFVSFLNNVWSEIIDAIIDESGYSNEQVKQYAIYTLYYSTEDVIESLNRNNSLTKFISSCYDFLNVDEPNINKLLSGFSLINVKFMSIDYDTSNKELFKAIYNNHLYQITFDHITLMLEKIYGYTQTDEINNKNYTLILSKPDEPLVKYVNDNINTYFKEVLNSCNELIIDKEQTALSVLNNPDINDEIKIKYIDYLQTEIKSLRNIDNKKNWYLLLENELVYYSEENILDYFFEFELDSSLVSFINSGESKWRLNKKLINEKYDDEASKFIRAIVTCNDLLNERYRTIISGLGFYYNSFNIRNIEDDKVKILVELNKIKMSEADLNFMREYYPATLMEFITHNIREYISLVSDEDYLDTQEIVSILDENVLYQYKIQLLNLTTEEISLVDKNYTDSVKLHIVENNLMITDLPYLMEKYPNQNDGVKMAIKNVVADNIDEIIAQEYDVPIMLLEILLNLNDIHMNTREELFVLALPKLNKKQTQEFLSILNMNDFLDLFKRKRPTFEINEVNEKILTIFKKRKWITKFDIDRYNSNLYRAYGRKDG